MPGYWSRHRPGRQSRRTLLVRGSQLLAGAGALGFVGCSSGDDDKGEPGGTASTGTQPAGSPSAGSPSAGTPRTGGTVRIVSGEPNTGFDPHLSQDTRTSLMLSLTHSFLVRRSQGPDFVPTSMTLEPDVAASMPEQPDDLTYVFTLRSDVRWHEKDPMNGRVFTAEDAKYSLERSVSDLSLFKNILPIDSVRAIDDTHLELKTSEPYADLLFQLGLGQKFWMLPREVEEKFGDFKNPANDVGTGPYMLDTFTPGSVYKYKKNPAYFESGLPYLDSVEVDISEDPSRTLSLFLAGEIDVYPGVKPDEVDIIKKSRSDAVIDEYLGSRADQLIYRCDRAPFTDPRVRRAFSMALNTPSWTKSLLGGEGQRDTPVSYALPEWQMDAAAIGDAAKWHTHNPTDAKALLDQAGFDYNSTITFEMTPARYGALYGTIGELIASDLKKIGVNTRIVALESNAFAEKLINNNNPDQLVWTAKSVVESVNYYLQTWYHPDGDLWYSKANDSELNKLMEEQARAVTLDDRKKLVDQAQVRIMDAAFATWGVMGNNRDAWSPKLNGFRYKSSEAYAAGFRSAWLSS